MKIKLLVYVNDKYKPGSIAEAVVSFDKTSACFYHDDASNSAWFLSENQFQIAAEQEKLDNKSLVLSVREFLGQDLARIEFK